VVALVLCFVSFGAHAQTPPQEVLPGQPCGVYSCPLLLPQGTVTCKDDCMVWKPLAPHKIATVCKNGALSADDCILEDGIQLPHCTNGILVEMAGQFMCADHLSPAER
jgi:hypothetical protein